MSTNAEVATCTNQSEVAPDFQVCCSSVDAPAATVPTPTDLVSFVCAHVSRERLPTVALVRLNRPSFQVLTVCEQPVDLGTSDVNVLHQCRPSGGGERDADNVNGPNAYVMVAFIDPSADLDQIRTWLQSQPGDGCADVLDRLIVQGDRWWSALCDDTDCCPAAGTSVEAWVAAGGAGAAACADGCSQACADERTNVCCQATQSQPPGWLTAMGSGDETARAQFLSEVQSHAAAVAVAATFEERLGLVDLVDSAAAHARADALIVAALAEVRLRDGLLRRWVIESDEQSREVVEESLIDCTAYLPASALAPTLTAIAGIAWRRGARDIAHHSVHAALESDRHYSLARLLQRALRSGVSSQVWCDAVEATSMHECLVGARR